MSGWRDTTCAGCGRRLAVRAEWSADAKAYCTTCEPGDLPLSPPMDGDGCEWDCRDPLDLLSREDHDALREQLREYARCRARALAAAHTMWLY
jgi:hypothetical protein